MLARLRKFVNKPRRDQMRAIGATLFHFREAARDIPAYRAKLMAERMIGGALAGQRVFQGKAAVYAAYRPDSDVTHCAHPELAALSAKWVAHNFTTNAGDLPRLYALVLNIKQVIAEGIEGDFAELGVYRGNSAAVLAHFGRTHGRATYLFDTYEGFDARDLSGIDRSKTVEFAETSLALVQSIVGEEGVNFVKGYFPQSVGPEVSAKKFAVVHLDCDLYEPMKAGLDFFYPRLSPGGIMILHDYSSLWWEGAKRAVDEFVATVRERLILLPDKSGTAMLRKSVVP